MTINTRGTVLDVHGKDLTWDARCVAFVRKEGEQWLCEARVPWDALPGKPDRIDFTHTEGKGGVKSEWAPTRGRVMETSRYGYFVVR